MRTTPLSALAGRINAAHARAESALRSGLGHARAAGALLLEAQDLCQQQQRPWLAWLRANVAFGERTAQRYMRLAREWDSLQCDTVTDLTQTEALNLLADSGGTERLAPLLSSQSVEYYTPANLVDRVVRCLGAIDLDPCSDSQATPNVPAARHFVREDDGLMQPWAGQVFLNPPYGREIGRWVERLVASHESGAVPEAVALLPARTDTDWFAAIGRFPLCLLRGRIRFVNGAGSAPFPTLVAYLGRRVDAFVDAFGDLGVIVVPYVNATGLDCT
jgi:hypothetical protein